MELVMHISPKTYTAIEAALGARVEYVALEKDGFSITGIRVRDDEGHEWTLLPTRGGTILDALVKTFGG
jgi:hypothetical protein